MYSLKNLFQKVGPKVTSCIRNLERTRVKLDRNTNHIDFLNACRKFSVVPKGLQLKNKLHTQQERCILETSERKILKVQTTILQNTSKRLNETDIDNLIQLYAHLSGQEYKEMLLLLNPLWEKKSQAHKLILKKKLDNLLQQNQLNKINHTHNNGINCTQPAIVNLSNKPLDKDITELLNLGDSYGIDATEQRNLDNLVRLDAYTKNKAEMSCKAATIMDKQLNNTRHKRRDKNLQHIINLKKDKDLLLTKADKGGRLVMMDAKSYEEKLDTFVKNSYKLLDKDPTNKLQANLRLFLRRTVNWDQKTVLKMCPTYPRKPIIYGLPKIHKPDNPLRPIIDQKKTVHAGISKHLADGLNKILKKPMSNVKNGKELASTLKKLNLTDATPFHLISIDVKDMFPSISPQAALKALNRKLNQVTDIEFRETLKMEKEHAIFLLQTILTNSYFQHKDQFFLQDTGLAMGSALSPILADVYMENVENNILRQFNKNIFFWKRYVDDTLIFWKAPLKELDEFMDWINKLESNLSFTLEIEKNGRIPFLDLEIMRSHNSIHTRFYQKPTAGSSLLHFLSHHPLKLKINVAVQKLMKIQELCSRNEDRIRFKRNLTKDLYNLKYPQKIVNRIFAKLKNKNKTSKTSTQDKQDGGKTFLPIFFNKAIQPSLNDILRPHSIAWKQGNKTLEVYKAANSVGKNLQKKNVVYLIPCSCTRFYIGETRRPVAIRLKEHQYCVKSQDQDSHIVSHLKQNPTHKIGWKQCITIDNEEDDILRKLKEAAYIYLNKDNCLSRPTLDISDTWKWILDKYKRAKNLFGNNVFTL